MTLRAYVGQTRDRALQRTLAHHGVGECVTRGSLPPRRTPWFYDCGAFGDWRAQRPFDGVRYLRDVWRIRQWPMAKPDFVVLPDLVAAGRASLAFSLDWLAQSDVGVPLYLAVQNGMEPADLVDVLTPAITGLFVGGDVPWKLATTGMWRAFTRSCGRQLHVGRVGSLRRVRWAQALEVDSIDSCMPLWSRDQLAVFLAAVGSQQLDLFARQAGPL